MKVIGGIRLTIVAQSLDGESIIYGMKDKNNIMIYSRKRGGKPEFYGVNRYNFPYMDVTKAWKRATENKIKELQEELKRLH
jgi:hypothetical protein